MKKHLFTAFLVAVAQVQGHDNLDPKPTDKLKKVGDQVAKEAGAAFDYLFPRVEEMYGVMVDSINRVRSPLIANPQGLKEVKFEKENTRLKMVMQFEQVEGAVESERTGDAIYLRIPGKQGTILVSLTKDEVRFESRIEQIKETEQSRQCVSRFSQKIQSLPMAIDVAKDPLVEVNRQDGQVVLMLEQDPGQIVHKIPVHEVAPAPKPFTADQQDVTPPSTPDEK
jgi:hypothetical protein